MEYEIYKTAGGKKRVNIGEQIYLLAPYEQGGNAPPANVCSFAMAGTVPRCRHMRTPAMMQVLN